MIQPHKPDPTVLTNTLLYLDGVEVAFDGYRALRGLSLIVQPGEMLAIIGPNGAGKTTMMDVITGKTRPDKGDVLFEGKVDLTKRDEADIAQLGIGRKFQKPTVFESQSVEDNILLALKSARGVVANLFWGGTPAIRSKVDEVLETIRLSSLRTRLAGSLSHGQKQWLEIGMLLAQDPKLLLVDEPAAGMTDTETHKTGELLLSLAGKHTIVVIEHDMVFVRQIATKVTVLHQGSILCEGTVDAVQNNEKVIEVYLGKKSVRHE